MSSGLFLSKIGSSIDQALLRRKLVDLGAHDCDYLFIHSELNFGLPNPALSKKELLGRVWDTIQSLGVDNILVPVFTFSFCNNEIYDPQNSRSSMGALPEYVRRLPQAKRSKDPLMSVALVGKDFSVIDDIGINSIGEQSTFDLLHRSGGTKFLFLGKTISSCMTYSHYIETVKNVPYRYRKSFTGQVIDGEIKQDQEYFLHVRYNNVMPYTDSRLDELALSSGAARSCRLGDSTISVVDEQAIFHALAARLDQDPAFMLSGELPDHYDDTYVYEKKVAL